MKIKIILTLLALLVSVSAAEKLTKASKVVIVVNDDDQENDSDY